MSHCTFKDAVWLSSTTKSLFINFKSGSHLFFGGGWHRWLVQSLVQGPKFGPWCHQGGAPGDNFRKISVQKTI